MGKSIEPCLPGIDMNAPKSLLDQPKVRNIQRALSSNARTSTGNQTLILQFLPAQCFQRTCTGYRHPCKVHERPSSIVHYKDEQKHNQGRDLRDERNPDGRNYKIEDFSNQRSSVTLSHHTMPFYDTLVVYSSQEFCVDTAREAHGLRGMTSLWNFHHAVP